MPIQRSTRPITPEEHAVFREPVETRMTARDLLTGLALSAALAALAVGFFYFAIQYLVPQKGAATWVKVLRISGGVVLMILCIATMMWTIEVLIPTVGSFLFQLVKGRGLPRYQPLPPDAELDVWEIQARRVFRTPAKDRKALSVIETDDQKAVLLCEGVLGVEHWNLKIPREITLCFRDNKLIAAKTQGEAVPSVPIRSSDHAALLTMYRPASCIVLEPGPQLDAITKSLAAEAERYAPPAATTP